MSVAWIDGGRRGSVPPRFAKTRWLPGCSTLAVQSGTYAPAGASNKARVKASVGGGPYTLSGVWSTSWSQRVRTKHG